MKSLLILDVAHGSDVAGKQSPDGSFREWKWSRDMCRRLVHEFFEPMKKNYDVACPYLNTDKEPGLVTRLNFYNSLSENYDFTWMLSLHNNAAADPPTWWKSKQNNTGTGGIEIWTDKEHNYSDELARVFFDTMRLHEPNEYYRINTPDDVSKDANFLILYGYKSGDKFIARKYEAALLEMLFMDNLVDIVKLKDLKWNIEMCKVIGLACNEVMITKNKS